MKIAFIHYHLKTGGVTTVLKRQIMAIRGACDALVMTGDRAAVELPCKVVEIPELGYDHPGISKPPPDRIVEQVIRVLRERWPGGCDVLHVHNPTLAKNRKFLPIIKKLQQAGVNLFLQIHDFAEDGRPDAYVEDEYPADCHYGVINLRDRDILLKAGLSGAGLHHIPNAVEGLSVKRGRCAKPQILYPVRAIRRKNLGEAILLSMFFKDGRRLAVTQPPNSPADVTAYRDWVDWVRKHRLRVDFEVGMHTDFPILVGSSESIVTTSISEGFGLTYLEPWTAGKPLWGRRLADICSDFETNGIHLKPFYDRLDVPLAWIDAEGFSRKWHAAVVDAAGRYGHPVAADAATRAFARMTHAEKVDFGLLSEKFQRQVLARLMTDPSAKAELGSLNPRLAHPGGAAGSSAIIESNRQAVLRHYGTEQYSERLLEIYGRIVDHPVGHRIDKAALRDAFFNLDRFSLLQWSPYDG